MVIMNRKTVAKLKTFILAITLVFVMTSCSMKDTQSSEMQSLPYDGNYPQHEVYGTGIDAMPGRVVWSHNPDSVDWDGSGYWWEISHLMPSKPEVKILPHISLTSFYSCRQASEILHNPQNAVRTFP